MAELLSPEEERIRQALGFAPVSSVLGPPDASLDAMKQQLGLQKKQDETKAAIQGAIEGLEHDPDRRAKDNTLAAKTGVSVAGIGDNTRKDLEFTRDINTMRQAIQEIPALRIKMSDTNFAAVAHDDMEALSAFDRIAKGFSRGQELHTLGIAGSELRRTRSDAAQKNVEDIQQRLEALGQDDEGFISWLASTSEVVGQMYTGLVGGGLAERVGGGVTIGTTLGAVGGPLAPVTSTAGAIAGAGAGFLSHLISDAFEVEGGLSYIEQLKLGVDPNVAKYTSLGVGTINAALEVAAATILLKPFTIATKQLMKTGIKKAFKTKGVKAAAAAATAAYVKGVGAEVGTEVLQEITNITAEEIGKLASDGEFKDLTADEVTDRLSQISIKTFKAMVFLGLPGPGAQFTTNRIKAHRAKRDSDTAKKLIKELGGSKMAERAPETAVDYAAEVLKQNGINEVLLSVDAVTALAESEGGIIADFYEKMGVADQIEEAQTTGQDIKLTPEQYAEHVLMPDAFQDLVDEVRYKSDDLTVKEAEQLETEELNEELAQLEGFDEAIDTLTPEEVTLIEEAEDGQLAPFVERATEDFNNPAGKNIHTETKKIREQFGDEAAEIYETRFRQLLDQEKKAPLAEAEQLPAEPRDPNIEIAEEQMGMKALFRTGDEAGMAPKKFTAYLVATDRAAGAGEINQREKKLRREKKQLTAEYKAEREKVRQEVQERLQQTPVYEMMFKIGRERFNKAAVIELLPNGAKQLKELPRHNGRNLYVHNGTIDPDAFTDVYGFFPDGQSMLFAMMDAGAFEQAVETETDKEMQRSRSNLLDEMTEVDAAIESVHNDDRVAVLALELNAMREAQGLGKLKVKELRDYAKLRLRDRTVGEIKPQKFLDEERRQAKLAGKLLRKGDRPGAIQAKFRQILNFEYARHAYKKERQIAREIKFLNKYLKKRKKGSTLPLHHFEAINEIVNAFILGPRLSEKGRERLMSYAEGQAAKSGTAVEIPQRILDEAEKTNFKDLTLGEWEAMVQTVKAIDKKGRLEHQLTRLDEKGSRLSVVTPIAALIRQNLIARIRKLGKPGVTTPTPVTFVRSMVDQVARAKKEIGPDFATILLNADSLLREIDNFQSLGPAYRGIKGGIDQAMTEGYTEDQIGFINRQKQEAEHLVQLFNVYNKKERLAMWKETQIPGVSVPLSHKEIISVLLNMGNAENIQALIESNQFTQDELVAIREHATKKDLDFAQATWNYLKKFQPEIINATVKREGYTPEMIEGLAFEHSEHGSYAGGYYPLRYDRHASVLAGQEQVQEIQQMMRTGGFIKSHTQRGHIEARVGSGGRTVLLDPFVINSHVDQVIYDLEVGDAVTDAYKVLHHPEIKKAFAEMGRVDYFDALDLWLGDVISGELHMGGFVEHGLRHLRSGITTSSLGFNAVVAGLQPLGIFQTAAHIGKADTLRGLAAFLSSPHVGENSIYKMAAAESAVMAGRETGFNKDITDAHRAFIQGWVSRVTPGKTADYIAAALFYFIVKMQRISDMVAYLGARQQGLRIHNGNIKKAIRHAGRAVIRAQASGQFQERTAIERGTITPRVRQTETVRIWSLFLSYFAAKMNVAWENTKKTNFKSPMSLLNWSTDMMLLFMVETAAALLVRGQWPDDDDDILPAIAAEGVAVFAQGIPIVREAVSEAKGFRGGGVVGAVAQATGDLSEQISQGEADKALARSIAKVAGIFLKFPVKRFYEAGDAVTRGLDGDDVEILEYLGSRKYPN